MGRSAVNGLLLPVSGIWAVPITPFAQRIISASILDQPASKALLNWIRLRPQPLIHRRTHARDGRYQEETTSVETFTKFYIAAPGNRREPELDLTTISPPPCSEHHGGSSTAPRYTLKGQGASDGHERQSPSLKVKRDCPWFARAERRRRTVQEGGEHFLYENRINLY